LRFSAIVAQIQEAILSSYENRLQRK